MKIRKVFFDMDGVLADFNRGVAELCRFEPPVSYESKTPEYDAQLWAHIRQTPHFYGRLEPVDGSLELFAKTRNGFDTVEILTGIPKPDKGVVTAAQDKREWVQRFIGADVAVHTVMREEKPLFCTGNNCVLIDDLASNIRAWEAAGGRGILFTDAQSAWQRLLEMSK